MIFLDTSAIFALADANDPHHSQAVHLLTNANDNDEEILVHNYILVEAAALMQRRLGLAVALQFLQQVQLFRMHWITAELHNQAVALPDQRGRRNLSLVDCMSFVIMRRYRIQQALAFDSDFETEGFDIYAADESSVTSSTRRQTQS